MDFEAQRRAMVEQHLAGRDVRDPRVLRALGAIPREEFITDPALREHAYADAPVAIGFGQTISQPYMVARMSELAEAGSATRVLEVGFGCGYQTAVLLELGAEVWGIELEKKLAAETQARLQHLGYTRFHLRAGDGYWGWPDQAPFDVILLAAAPLELPEPLLGQLLPGGRLIAPVGPEQNQRLVRVRRAQNGVLQQENIMGVRFVPLRGQALMDE